MRASVRAYVRERERKESSCSELIRFTSIVSPSPIEKAPRPTKLFSFLLLGRFEKRDVVAEAI